MSQEFTVEDIRMLAKIERDMDAGTQPFVYVGEGKGRWAMECDEMDAALAAKETKECEDGERIAEGQEIEAEERYADQ